VTDTPGPDAAGAPPPPPHAEGRETKDPIAAFVEAFERAKRRETKDATAVVLATADASGQPSARVVLLKHVDERGFVVYTNYGSRKAHQLDANPKAALCAYWESIAQQIRVEGRVERVSGEESDAYFASRARLSQIGAWASRQSEPLESRAQLLGRVAKYEARYLGRTIPRPPFWGGFRIVPERIEFWWNQLHRLHDRVVYTRDGDGWRHERLYP
jgi:pyridoxamine 5'-phosphate oxidase